MQSTNKIELVQVFEALKAGLKPAEIAEKYNIPKTTLQYKLDVLKKKDIIKKVSYGVWEVVKKKYDFDLGAGSLKVRKSKQIRGHAFIWKVRFKYKEIDWFKRLNKSKIKYQKINNGTVARIIFNNRKIWLTKKGMVVYEPLDFLGSSSFETKGTAVWELDQLIKEIGRQLQINLIPYKFTTSREHYALVKNSLAKQYNDKKEKLYVYAEDKGVWLWVDFSKGIHELENKDPTINRNVQNWYNDHLKHNFEVNSSFVLNGFSVLTEQTQANARNLNNYAIHLKAHVASVKELGSSTTALTRQVAELTKIISDLKKK